MVEPVRHRQTKGAATDMFDLHPPRHISTLPFATEMVRCGELSKWAIHVIRCTAEKHRSFPPSPTNHPMAINAGSGHRPPHQKATYRLRLTQK